MKLSTRDNHGSEYDNTQQGLGGKQLIFWRAKMVVT